MSQIERTPSELNKIESKTGLKDEAEDVKVDKNLDSQDTRHVHICTLCHTQLHKICSLDPNITIIAVAKEGGMKTSGVDSHSAHSKVGDSSPASSLRSPSKSALDSGDKDRRKKTDEWKGDSSASSSGSGMSSGFSGGFSGGGLGRGKGGKNWKKDLEEEERKKKKKFEEEENARRQQAKGPQSTNKPSHEEWKKKKKKEY